jgi:cytoskeleton protein RodZ
MSELGRLLSEARASRDLTLAQVESVIRIRQKYLEAFESGNYAALPRGATTRGFLRNYARFLGLDSTEAVRAYIAETGDASSEAPVPGGEQLRPIDYRPLEVELIDESRDSGWWRWAVALMVVIVLGALAWGIYSERINLKLPGLEPLAALVLPQPTTTATVTTTPTRWIVRVTPTPPPPPPTVVQAQAAQPVPPRTAGASTLLPLPTPTVPPTITPTARATATPEAVAAARISVLLRISQRSWVLVNADGTVALQEILEAGQERTFEADQSLHLRTGNAGGVNLVVNGQEQGMMGGFGQVVDRGWQVADGQIVEVTMTPRPPAAPATSGG